MPIFCLKNISIKKDIIFQKIKLHLKKICDIPPQGQLVTFIYHNQYDTINIWK